jgi:hypothetical protein
MRRQNADDRVGRAGKRDRVAKNGGIRGEAATPQAGADHDYVGTANAVFSRQEGAAEHGRNAEDAEEVGGDALRVDDFGLAGAGEGHLLGGGEDTGIAIGAGGGA